MWTSRTLHPVKTRGDTSKIELWLYQHDGPALLRNLKRQETDKVRKNIIRVFNDIGFTLEIENNLKEVDFLHVPLNLRSGNYRPYKKPKDRLFCIYRLSNHPPNVIKQILNSIQERLSKSQMRRYSTQQNLNTKIIWREVGSKLILNNPKTNDKYKKKKKKKKTKKKKKKKKKKKIDLEISFGLTLHSTKQYPQIL